MHKREDYPLQWERKMLLNGSRKEDPEKIAGWIKQEFLESETPASIGRKQQPPNFGVNRIAAEGILTLLECYVPRAGYANRQASWGGIAKRALMMKSIADAVRKMFPFLGVDQKTDIQSEFSIQKGRALHAADLRRLLVSCTACGLNFDAHSYSAFAMTISSEDTKLRVTDFLAAIRENRWQDVLTYSEFDGGKDAVEATAIRCPKGTTTVVIEFDPQELFYNRSILELEVLSIQSSHELNSLIRDVEWYAL